MFRLFVTWILTFSGMKWSLISHERNSIRLLRWNKLSDVQYQTAKNTPITHGQIESTMPWDYQCKVTFLAAYHQSNPLNISNCCTSKICMLPHITYHCSPWASHPKSWVSHPKTVNFATSFLLIRNGHRNLQLDQPKLSHRKTFTFVQAGSMTC